MAICIESGFTALEVDGAVIATARFSQHEDAGMISEADQKGSYHRLFEMRLVFAALAVGRWIEHQTGAADPR
jgi:hypothetical protein